MTKASSLCDTKVPASVAKLPFPPALALPLEGGMKGDCVRIWLCVSHPSALPLDRTPVGCPDVC